MQSFVMARIGVDDPSQNIMFIMGHVVGKSIEGTLILQQYCSLKTEAHKNEVLGAGNVPCWTSFNG